MLDIREVPLIPERVTFVLTDGGRAAAGFKGETRDCATRAIAIAAGFDYQDVYDRINALGKQERKGKRKRGVSNARLGVYRFTTDRLMEELGATWTPTMTIGSGCTVHVRADELPAGRLVLKLSRHLAAFIDGVLYDDHDCSRGGTRCVYGFYTLPDLEHERRRKQEEEQVDEPRKRRSKLFEESP